MTFPNPFPTIPKGTKLHCHSPRMPITIYDKQKTFVARCLEHLNFSEITCLLEKGLPRWHNGKEPVCQCRRSRLNPWVGEIPCRRQWQPAPGLLLGKSHGQRKLEGYRPWNLKVWHNWVTSTHTHLSEKLSEFRTFIIPHLSKKKRNIQLIWGLKFTHITSQTCKWSAVYYWYGTSHHWLWSSPTDYGAGIKEKINFSPRTSLVVQRLRLCTLSAGGPGSIPG